MGEQLLLFHYQRSDVEELNDDLEQVIEKLDRYRKSMHAKLSTLSSQTRSLEARVDILEAQIYIQMAFMKKYVEKELDQCESDFKRESAT
jgi:chaperonin cofactor prefoldin